jgi:hypothetical protein
VVEKIFSIQKPLAIPLCFKVEKEGAHRPKLGNRPQIKNYRGPVFTRGQRPTACKISQQSRYPGILRVSTTPLIVHKTER